MKYIVSYRYNGVVYSAVFRTLKGAESFLTRLNDKDATITIKD